MKYAQDFDYIRTGDLLVRRHGFAVAIELFDMSDDHDGISDVTAMYFWTRDCWPRTRGELMRVGLMSLYGSPLVR